MQMQPVVSTNVAAVGYDAMSNTLRVQFQNGGIYDYHDVDPSLYESMLQPNPWRRVGSIVRRHRYRKLA
ncbi:hypothetical protein RKD05_002359 [Microbacterium sp. SLBN-111]